MEIPGRESGNESCHSYHRDQYTMTDPSTSLNRQAILDEDEYTAALFPIS